MIKFPFTSLQQLNLDWIMQQLHKILQFMPLNGAAGDVLQRTVDGAAWQPLGAVSMDIHGLTSTTPAANDEMPIYDNDLAGNYKVTVQDVLDMIPAAPVTSVNGQTGTVTLTASDVGALADTTPIPTDVSDLNNDLGFVDAAGAAAAAPVQSVSGKTGAVTLVKGDVGLGNVDNVQQYSASNPPPYPVTSVNGQTGDVTVAASGITFPADTMLAIASHPADITIYGSDLWGAVSDDGNYIRIYGNIKTSSPTSTAGWKEIVVSGITVTPPATGKAIYNCGIGFFSNTGSPTYDHILRDAYGNLRIIVHTDGAIGLGIYIPYVADPDVYTFSFMPFLLPLG